MHLANQAQLITCIWLLLALKQQQGQNGNAEAQNQWVMSEWQQSMIRPHTTTDTQQTWSLPTLQLALNDPLSYYLADT